MLYLKKRRRIFVGEDFYLKINLTNPLNAKLFISNLKIILKNSKANVKNPLKLILNPK